MSKSPPATANLTELVEALAADLGRVSFASDEEERFRSALASADVAEVIAAVTALRKLVAREQKPYLAGVRALLPELAELLRVSADADLLVELLWVLTNVCSGSQADTQAVLESGVLPIVVGLVQFDDTKVAAQAAWCIGNIAGDFRDVVLQNGGLEALIACHGTTLRAGRAGAYAHAQIVWAMSNCVRGRPPVDAGIAASVVRPIGETLASLAPGADGGAGAGAGAAEAVADCFWTLSFVSEGNAVAETISQDPGLLAALVRAVGSRNRTVLTPALRTLGNLVSGNDATTQRVLDAGLLDQLHALLGHIMGGDGGGAGLGRGGILKEIMWAISNITAGSPGQVRMTIRHPVIHRVVDSLRPNQPAGVLREIFWIFDNVSSSRDSLLELIPNTQCAVFRQLAGLAAAALEEGLQPAYLRIMIRILRIFQDNGNLSLACAVLESFIQQVQGFAGQESAELLHQLEVTLTAALDQNDGQDQAALAQEAPDPTARTDATEF